MIYITYSLNEIEEFYKKRRKNKKKMWTYISTKINKRWKIKEGTERRRKRNVTCYKALPRKDKNTKIRKNELKKKERRREDYIEIKGEEERGV